MTFDYKEYLDDIINAVADPIFVKDKQHRWILLNDAFCSFMGHKREDLLGKTDYDFFPKSEAEVFWKKDEEVFTDKRENVNEEFFTDARGVKHVIITKKVLCCRAAAEEQFIVGVIRDITDIKKTEGELKEKLRQLEIFNKVAIDREVDMRKLKSRITELEGKITYLEDRLKRSESGK